MSLTEYAKQELSFAGFPEDDSIAGDIQALVDLFASQESSSNIFAAASVVSSFAKLAAFNPLTPISSNSAEWTDLSESNSPGLWQSKRSPSVFSTDGGTTWYDLDDASARLKSRATKLLTRRRLSNPAADKDHRCGSGAEYGFTWPGTRASLICRRHAEHLIKVADAIGLLVELIPIPLVEGINCRQIVRD